MTVTELAKRIGPKHGLSNAAAQRVIEDLIEQIGNQVAKGQYIRLGKLGSFSVVKRKARTARNPRTGDTVKVAAKKVVKFKLAKSLNDTLNRKK